MIFHGPTPLRAREVFTLNLNKHQPLVLLIGCGSGRERLGVGDEPLGFISAFLLAGAATVVATMWPIHDRLSGKAFSEGFYELDCGRRGGGAVNDDGKVLRYVDVDLARRLRRAVLDIRAAPETAAPYFWAGFVLYGDWEFGL
jgi:CHAT domain-containing protein